MYIFRKLTAIFVFSIIIIDGWALRADEKVRSFFDYKAYRVEKDLINKESYEWGLALSGGGLRASLFSFGVLKAFYDAGFLNRIDLISSVSGGGYTAYAAYTSDDIDDFGSSLLHQNNIYEETCKLIATGNFVTVLQMLDALISINPKQEAIDLYHRSIGRTFGKNDKSYPLMQMHQLLPDIQAGKAPFFIVNTTIQNPHSPNWTNELFEFTPIWMGNDAYGYDYWNTNNSFELRQAIAISGAAFNMFLNQSISVILPKKPSRFDVTLSDGGHSENLGAIALIKRGVKNIVIIDAEHDPDYNFTSYKKLKENLKAFNSNLVIESIDNFSGNERLKSAVHIGKAIIRYQDRIIEPTVYYVKMAMPVSIDKILKDKKKYKRGSEIESKYKKVLDSAKNKNGYRECSELKNSNFVLSDWYAYKVARYSKYLNHKNYVRHSEKLPGDFFYAKFPQYSTVDQSFYLDQALAFIGLGYFEALELIKHPKFQMTTMPKPLIKTQLNTIMVNKDRTPH